MAGPIELANTACQFEMAPSAASDFQRDLAGALCEKTPAFSSTLLAGYLTFKTRSVVDILRGPKRRSSSRRSPFLIPGQPAMPFNPLAQVTDYQSMLNRIFWSTSGCALVGIWMLRLNSQELDRFLSTIDLTMDFGSNRAFPVAGGYLLPALGVGMFTRIFRFHARISDWLSIRECFDLDVIIHEFAARFSMDLSVVSDEQLKKSRHRIMRYAFYRYVSGPQPAVDPQLVQQALDAWSWLWIGVEATLVFVVTGLALVAGGAYSPGFQTMAATLVIAAVGLPILRNQCQRYAIAQVRAIMADPTRATEVRSAFAELAGDELTRRRAA